MWLNDVSSVIMSILEKLFSWMNVNVLLGWIVRGNWGLFVVELVFSGDEKWVMVISFEVRSTPVKALE